MELCPRRGAGVVGATTIGSAVARHATAIFRDVLLDEAAAIEQRFTRVRQS